MSAPRSIATAIYLFLFVCSAGYILFGIVQMAWPEKALPVYRFFLGRKRFARSEERMRSMGKWVWKFVGACYIGFGMLVVWSMMQSLRAR